MSCPESVIVGAPRPISRLQHQDSSPALPAAALGAMLGIATGRPGAVRNILLGLDILIFFDICLHITMLSKQRVHRGYRRQPGARRHPPNRARLWPWSCWRGIEWNLLSPWTSWGYPANL